MAVLAVMVLIGAAALFIALIVSVVRALNEGERKAEANKDADLAALFDGRPQVHYRGPLQEQAVLDAATERGYRVAATGRNSLGYPELTFVKD